MSQINIINELGKSLLSFILLGIVIHFMSKKLKTKNSSYKFKNPRKSAIYSIISVTISILMLTGLMLLAKTQNNTREVAANIQKYSLNSVINIIISYLILMSPILIAKKIENEAWESTGISRHNFKAALVIGIALALLAIGVVLFNLKDFDTVKNILTPNSIWALFYYAVVGFSEEFMYRGYLQARLMAWLGRWKGWIMSAIVMALVHIPQRLAMNLPLTEAIASSILLVPISLTMGYIMIKTENIIAPAIYHTFADWAYVLM